MVREKFRLALHRTRLIPARRDYAAFFRFALTPRAPWLVRLADFVVSAMLRFNTSTTSMTLVSLELRLCHGNGPAKRAFVEDFPIAAAASHATCQIG
jgi:hypothetical protein